MYKKIVLVTTLSFMTALAFSQTHSSIEKAYNDPKRAENSAKADRYVQSKHVIRDTTQTATVPNAKTAAVKHRKTKRKSH